jgi:hypothetical protein
MVLHLQLIKWSRLAKISINKAMRFLIDARNICKVTIIYQLTYSGIEDTTNTGVEEE